MPSFERRSLLWKYAAWFSAVVCLLLAVSGGIGANFVHRESLAGMQALQRSRALEGAREIVAFVERTVVALRASANKLGARDTPGLDDLRLELASLLRHRPEITELRWIGPDGLERLALLRYGLQAAGSGRDWSEDPRLRAARVDGESTGGLYFRKGSEPYVTVAVAGESGVLAAEVNLKALRDALTGADGEPEVTVFVVDRQGRLVAHPQMDRVLASTHLNHLPQVQRALAGPKTAQVGEGLNLDGEAVVSAAAPVGRLGWTVFAEQPLSRAMDPVRASVARSLLMVGLGLLVAVGASVLLARRMVQPIRTIEAGARQLGQGHFAWRIQVDGEDELATLARQFNCMAEQLQDTHSLLERRVDERTRELALANAAKTRFLAAASHDLGQPLHALTLFVDQLRQSHLPEPQRHLVHCIDQAAQSLQSLTETLLDLSRLDAGAARAHPRDLPLFPLLARVGALMAPAAAAKGLRLRVAPTSVWVRSDPALLERVVLNLLSNAVRYTPRGRVLVGCRPRGDEVELVVADTGVGIEPEHLSLVFQEFFRAAPGTAGPGLGLGLSIVQRLARLLGHGVALSSQPGRGTVVRLRLPRVRPARHESEDFPPPAGLQGRRVLVIDDEAASRDAVCGLLQSWGCQPVAAGTAEEALACTRRQRPELVLCDLLLGRGDNGIELLARLRREQGGALPAALITGSSDAGLLAQAIAEGLPVLHKPAAPARLRALVEHLAQPA